MDKFDLQVFMNQLPFKSLGHHSLLWPSTDGDVLFFPFFKTRFGTKKRSHPVDSNALQNVKSVFVGSAACHLFDEEAFKYFKMSKTTVYMLSSLKPYLEAFYKFKGETLVSRQPLKIGSITITPLSVSKGYFRPFKWHPETIDFLIEENNESTLILTHGLDSNLSPYMDLKIDRLVFPACHSFDFKTFKWRLTDLSPLKAWVSTFKIKSLTPTGLDTYTSTPEKQTELQNKFNASLEALNLNTTILLPKEPQH